MTQYTAGMLDAIEPEAIINCAEAIDTELDYDNFLITDRLNFNPYAVLSVIADRTNDIGLGTAVTNPYSRHPAVTAAGIATVDHLSGGRALLGLGVGSPAECRSLGYDQSRPIGTLRDAIRAIRELLDGNQVTIQREEFELKEATIGTPPTHVPIYIGGRGPQVLTLAGYRADGVLTASGLVSPEGLRYTMEHVRNGAEKRGRDVDDIDIVCWGIFSMADDSAVAVDAINPLVANIVQSIPLSVLELTGINEDDAKQVKQIDNLNDLSPSELRERVPLDLLKHMAIVGSPQECREQVRDLLDVGVSHIGLLTFGNEENDPQDCLKQFSDEVISVI